MTITEHVARAIFASRCPDADFLDHMYSSEREDSTLSARAAIIATIQYARGNITDDMFLEGGLGFGAKVSNVNVEAGFTAMLSALLTQIEGGEKP